MKKSEIEQEFFVSSGMLSSCIRTIDLGIIAVVWALSNQRTDIIVSESTLQWGIIFAVASLACDVLHYIWRSLAMGISLKRAEKNDKISRTEKNDHEYIRGTGTLSYFFWILKTILCIISSVYILIFFIRLVSSV